MLLIIRHECRNQAFTSEFTTVVSLNMGHDATISYRGGSGALKQVTPAVRSLKDIMMPPKDRKKPGLR